MRAERMHLPPALVVGACGVMGIAIARRLAQRHMVYLADINEVGVNEAAAKLRREGASVIPVHCDVTQDASVAAMAERIGAGGGLQVLAHVVALSPSMAAWDRIVVDAVAPFMRPCAAAVLISSTGGHMVTPNEAETAVLDDPLAANFLEAFVHAHGGQPDSTQSYMWSKRGLMLTRRLAGPWGARNVRIVTVSPGFIATAMGDLEFAHQRRKHEFKKRMPIPRVGSVIEVADAVDFLASDRASYITGCDLLVDGGMNTLI